MLNTLQHLFRRKYKFFSQNVFFNMKFTQRISEINQLMTNNQHVLDALRSVIGRFTYIKIKVLIHTVVNVIRKNATAD